MAKFNVGDTVYLVESNRMIREVLIVKYAGDFYTIRFKDTGGGIKVREHRLYASKEEAESAIDKAHPKQKSTWSRWDL